MWKLAINATKFLWSPWKGKIFTFGREALAESWVIFTKLSNKAKGRRVWYMKKQGHLSISWLHWWNASFWILRITPNYWILWYEISLVFRCGLKVGPYLLEEPPLPHMQQRFRINFLLFRFDVQLCYAAFELRSYFRLTINAAFLGRVRTMADDIEWFDRGFSRVAYKSFSILLKEMTCVRTLKACSNLLRKSRKLDSNLQF